VRRRYYDFNVWTGKKRVEELRYIHRNPVRRGLVERQEDWLWSSSRHYVFEKWEGWRSSRNGRRADGN
jgi:putative transposase